MTKESLHPGLGSGALRELREQIVALRDRAQSGLDAHRGVAPEWAGGLKALNQVLGLPALSLSSPIEPTRHCNAPNPDGSYLCNKELGHSGDHVHRFTNSEEEKDFYFWPATSQASSEIRERLAAIPGDVDTLLSRMIYGETVEDIRRKVAGYLERALSLSSPVARKEYKHFAACNGDRGVPAGDPGHSCSCFSGKHMSTPQASSEMRRARREEAKGGV